MFEKIEYEVIRIDGDYAFLKNLSKEMDEEQCVARALLPENIKEGCKLAYEMFEYTII
ncbi:MAG: chorismate--pyruvate lyase [Lachnospiraceae bacterium]|nr:chorismate--pyruvate lyase [Lachnospiraceae bacterium]